MADQITNYQCPACTGPLHFVGASGRLECDYCGSSYSVDEIEALYQRKDAQAAAETAAADEAAASPDGDEGAWTAPEGGDWDDAIPARPAARSSSATHRPPRPAAPTAATPRSSPAACPARRNRTISSPSASARPTPSPPSKSITRKSPFCPRPFPSRTISSRSRASTSRSGSSAAAPRATSPTNAPGR